MSRKKATKRSRGAAKKRAGRSAAPKRAAASGRSAGVKRGAAGGRAVTKQKATKKTAARGSSEPASRVAKSKRPRLTLVKGKGARPAAGRSRHKVPGMRAMPVAVAIEPEPGAAERGGQASKERVMLDLMRARAQLIAVIDGLSAAAAERPIAPGKWCVREIVLHLALRDRARLAEMESTQRGVPRSWMGFTVEDWKEQNARDLASVEHLDWDAALELLSTTRQELIEALEVVPEEPAEVWSESHAFGSMLSGLPSHDAHHGEQVRRWRVKENV